MTSFSATAIPVSLLTSLLLACSVSGAAAKESRRLPVEVNPGVLNATPAAPRLPTRVIDGETVIILIPPELQPAKPAEKIVTPRPKPRLKLPPADAEASPPPAPAPETAAAKIPTPPPPEETPAAAPGEAAAPAAAETPETEARPVETATNADQTETMTDAAASESEAEAAPQGTAEETISPVTEAEKIVEKIVGGDKAETVETAETAETPAAPADERVTRLLFAEESSKLSAEAEATLKAVAAQMATRPRSSVQLLAYGSGASVSAARRLSLDRALTVRARLMELGLSEKQIEVRALGEPQDTTPSNRVDLLLITR